MTPGTQLGSYEIISALGKGGMGEVWRARDSKLGREVAIKTLPEEFAKDEERLARFEREAKLLASLNHPNIATIHGLEEDNGTRFLVLELVEGDTVADRLKHGAIPVEESLKLALQIAEALEAAHEKGVIHRDLKPANIKVTPDGKVKVLDFGLAKAFAGDGSEANVSQSPTLSMAATEQGVILGTAAYMSPEQTRGRAVDKRTDVWAFGCVLFEMLTGRRSFPGNDVTDILAAVIRAEPEWSCLPANVHPRLRELLERCLEKEAHNRWQAVGDVRMDIRKVLSDPSGVSVGQAEVGRPARWRTVVPWALATLIVGVISGWMLTRETPMLRPVARFAVEIPEGDVLSLALAVALSPDDKYLVYSANDQLYLREVAQMGAVPIRGTEGAVNPFFSPDSQWIGFAANGQLQKIPIGGGPPVPLCEAATLRGANWLPDDTIVFSTPPNLMRVSANGGEPEILVSLDSAAGETNLLRPDILPDGDTLLFGVATGTGFDDLQIVTQSISTGERRSLLPGGIPVRYLTTGHVVYIREGVLLAAPFDSARGEITGGSVALVEGIAGRGRYGHVTISASGSLVYLTGQALGVGRSLVWVDREGGEQALEAPLRGYANPSVSPEGTRVALYISDDDRDIWIWDVERKTLARSTFDPAIDGTAIWTPDGERLVFRSERDGVSNLFWRKADGTGLVERLTTSANFQVAMSVSPDGQTLVFAEGQGPVSAQDRDLYMVSLEGGSAEVLLNTEFNEQNARISPDGGWLAYTSNESGQDEIYVRPFPDVESGKWQVSILPRRRLPSMF